MLRWGEGGDGVEDQASHEEGDYPDYELSRG